MRQRQRPPASPVPFSWVLKWQEVGGACARAAEPAVMRCSEEAGGFLLFIDTLARTMARSKCRSILTAVIGTPFFIWLLAGMQRELVMTLAGRALSIGYSDRVVGRVLTYAYSR